jgi:LuxR family quorum sensing-dependent transcriptional regulator
VDIAKRAFDVVAASEHVGSLAELERVAGAELRAFGFDVVIGVEIVRHSGAQAVKPVFGDVSAPSILHYLAQGHPAYCPVIRAACSAPMLWQQLKGKPLRARERRVFDELGEFAMREGHVIAVHTPDRNPIAVSLAGSAVALDSPDERAAVHLLSTHYGLIGAKLTEPPSRQPVLLSQRQREILSWVREGKSSYDVGEILGISARTVDGHILAACQSLGVRTRVQGVVEAALRGLIEL